MNHTEPTNRTEAARSATARHLSTSHAEPNQIASTTHDDPCPTYSTFRETGGAA